jgi:hypothetical protein
VSADLFGNIDPPRKGGPDYLQWLNELELPEGLTFWSLSPNSFPPGVPQKYVENLWCKDRDGRFVHLVLDLRTQDRYRGEKQ